MYVCMYVCMYLRAYGLAAEMPMLHFRTDITALKRRTCVIVVVSQARMVPSGEAVITRDPSVVQCSSRMVFCAHQRYRHGYTHTYIHTCV